MGPQFANIKNYSINLKINDEVAVFQDQEGKNYFIGCFLRERLFHITIDIVVAEKQRAGVSKTEIEYSTSELALL